MKGNPFDSDGFKLWADEMRARLIPKMRNSGSVAMIAPNMSADFDISFALQIGASILLEKPVILLVPSGRIIPPKLRAIADRIIEVDLGATINDAEIQDQLARAITDFAKQ